jgi:hypothetical protein
VSRAVAGAGDPEWVAKRKSKDLVRQMERHSAGPDPRQRLY